LTYRPSEGYRYQAIAALSNASRRAVAHLEQAAADPRQWLAPVALGRLAIASGNEEDRVAALISMRAALSYAPDNPALIVTLADLLQVLQQPMAARQLLQQTRLECAPVRHALAEALIATGETTKGVAVYLSALRSGDGNEMTRFFDDLTFIATPLQLQSYRGLPIDQRKQWLIDFWTRSAARSATTVSDRILQQLNRNRTADQAWRAQFAPLDDAHIPSWIADTAHFNALSGAGTIYARRGPPRFVFHAVELDHEFEAWVYSAGAHNDVFLITRRHLFDEPWQLVHGRPDCGFNSYLGRIDFARINARLLAGEPLNLRELYLVLGRFDPAYGEWAHFCTASVGGAVPNLDMQTLARTMSAHTDTLLRTAGWSEYDWPQFDTLIRMNSAAYQFRDAHERPEMAVVFSLPAADVAATNTRKLQVTVALTDSIVFSQRRDTLLEVPAHPLVGGMLQSVVYLPVTRSGSFDLAVTVKSTTSNAGSSAARRVTTREISPGVGMSDIVIADSVHGGGLVRDTVAISPIPNNVVIPGPSFRLYFETYGVQPGLRVRFEIEVSQIAHHGILEKLGLKRPLVRRVSFEQVPAERQGEPLVTDVLISGNLPPGRYRIVARARLPDGQMASRSAPLEVLNLN
jgi:hypothetical protein